MGAAPSLEILRQAPFRSLQSGPRQIGLIPITPDFFPSADCALFRQFYDARNDPSVRYYQRNGVDDDFNLEIIPVEQCTRETLYAHFMHIAEQLTFHTNAAVREELEAGNDYKVRPISCAIVFLYDGIQYVADGSVRLEPPFRSQAASAFTTAQGPHSHGPVYVKVIGGIMDITPLQLWAAGEPTARTRPLTPDLPVNLRMFITKSAGDHNMVRVTLLTAYTYRRHFVDLIGVSSVPKLRAVFQTPKTYIPFLCFMRELRDRAIGLFEGPAGPYMWVDDKCLLGDIPAMRAVEAVDAYARYYVEQVEQQAMQRAMKLAAKAGLNPPSASIVTASTTMGLSGPHTSTNTEAAKPASHSLSAPSSGGPSGLSVTLTTTTASGSVGGGGFGETGAREKINYVLRGYIVTAECDIPAYSFQPHEVFVACCESRVRVMGVMRVPAWRGPRPLPVVLSAAQVMEEKEREEEEDGEEWFPPSTVPTADTSTASTPKITVHGGTTSGDVLTEFTLHRGDIVSFFALSPLTTPDDAAGDGVSEVGSARTGTEAGGAGSPSSASSTFNNSSGHVVLAQGAVVNAELEKASASPLSLPNNIGKKHTSSSTDGRSAATPRWPCPRRGLWQKDEGIFIESVLLSLVKDECKNAREADIDDPRWLHDDEKHCPKHDGVFYIWKFRRGKEVFYYGTVPKFANPNRAAAQNGGNAGAHAKQVTAAQERKAASAANRANNTSQRHPQQPQSQQQQQQQQQQTLKNRQAGTRGAVAPGRMATQVGMPVLMSGGMGPFNGQGMPQPYVVMPTPQGGPGTMPAFTTSGFMGNGVPLAPGYTFTQQPGPVQPQQQPQAQSRPGQPPSPSQAMTYVDGTSQIVYMTAPPPTSQTYAPHTPPGQAHFDPSVQRGTMNMGAAGQKAAHTQQQHQQQQVRGAFGAVQPQSGVVPIAYGPPTANPQQQGSEENGTGCMAGVRSGAQSPQYTASQQVFLTNAQHQSQSHPSTPLMVPASSSNGAYMQISSSPTQVQPHTSPFPMGSTASGQMAYVMGPNNQIYLANVTNQPAPSTQKTSPQMYTLPQPQSQPATFQQGRTFSMPPPQLQQQQPSPVQTQIAPPQVQQQQQQQQQQMYVVINGQLYQMGGSGAVPQSMPGAGQEAPVQYMISQQYAAAPATTVYWN